MTGETSNENTSKEVGSLVPKLLSNPHTPGKVIPMAPTVVTQRPHFPYSHIVLSEDLRANIDKNWDACWPINMLRPLVLLDLISYLLFIKKLEEKQLVAGAEIVIDNFIHTMSEVSWSRFKDLDAQSMHQVFTEEKGISDIIKNYGHTNRQYSLFVKEPLLLAPTAKLLLNMVDIIKIMEGEDRETMAAIFEYLLYKAEIVGQNGQVYAPGHIIKLIVALMQPTQQDLIGDPAAGNGSFLVNSAMYIANKNSAAIPNIKNELTKNIYKGIESDLVQLRIGAMNMILHGIEDPKLEGINILSKTNLTLREQPTLIMSNLFFEGTEDKMTVKANTLQTETRRKEISFLNLILKSLKKGGRAAVIIREIILYDNITEIKTIREHIIDDHNLEAVISLPGKTGSLFSGACILIFSKPESGTTDKVWFYKMEAKEGINKKGADSLQVPDGLDFPGDYIDAPDILTRWKNEEEKGKSKTGKSFYVSRDEIKANHYNLNFNEYRKIENEPEIPIPYKSPITDNESAPVNIIQEQAKPYVAKTKLPPQAVPVKKRRSTPIIVSVLFTCIAALASYFMFFIDKDDNTVSTTTKDSLSTARSKAAQSAQKPATNAPEPGMLSREQIRAILKDTTGILHFPEEAAELPASTKDPRKGLAKSGGTKGLVDKKAETIPETIPEKVPVKVPDKAPSITPETATPANALNIKYTVTDTTYFHDEPDKSTRRKSYLDPLNKNVLKPIDDRNGFIYVVYTNHFGRTSKGWINKKDLKPVP